MLEIRGKKLSAILLGLALLAMPMAVFADDDPPEPVYQLTGTVYQYPYEGTPDDGTPLTGKQVTITLKEGTTTVESADEGKISYTFDDVSKRTDDGKYSWAIEKDENYFSSSGLLEEGTQATPKENSLYVRERYIPKASDYRFSESEDVKIIDGKVWVRTAGDYQIEGKSGKKLSKTLDGESSDSLTIAVDEGGALDSFYIYTGEDCSKVLDDQSVNVDSGAPIVTSVSTEPANERTYVKEHGTYGREKAEIVLNVDVVEESALKEVYLLARKGGETTRYDTTKKAGSENKYEAVIPLPEEETIMNAQLVKLVAVDIFGNKSSEVLLAALDEGQTEEDENITSRVTLERIAPSMTVGINGKSSSFGWYSELPTLSAEAIDNLSGLALIRIYGQNYVIAERNYDGKVKTSQSVNGEVKFNELTKDGSYIYTAEATDNAGNTVKKEYNIRVDLDAPSITATGAENGAFYNTNPSIEVSEKEKYYNAEGNRIFVKVTRNGTTVLEKTHEKVNSAAIPKKTFKKDGVYRVTMYAMDAADNRSNTISYKFTKDATAPAVSISGVTEGKFYNKRQAVTVKVKEYNYSTDNVSVSAVRKLGNTTRNAGFPWKNKAVETVNTSTFGETGTYTITASAKDKAGNQSQTKRISFTVDTKPPVINITGVRDGGVYTYGQGLSPNATVTDDYLANKSISFTKAGQPIGNPGFSQIKENDGLYTMTVTATDKAGNSARKQISFTVNRFGSYFEYNDAIKNLQGKAVQNVSGDLVITEKNVSKVTASDPAIYRDGKAIDAKGKTDATEGGAENVYRHVYASSNFEQEGAYEINVTSKDEAGNEMESKEENGPVKFFVDRTEPSLMLAGIDPKGNKAESITVNIKTDDLLTGVKEVKAYVNGEEVYVNESEDGTRTFEIGTGMRQSVKVTSTDGAGNTAEVTDTASVSTNTVSLIFNRFGIIIGAAAAAIAALLIFLFFKRRKKKEENAA